MKHLNRSSPFLQSDDYREQRSLRCNNVAWESDFQFNGVNATFQTTAEYTDERKAATLRLVSGIKNFIHSIYAGKSRSNANRWWDKKTV